MDIMIGDQNVVLLDEKCIFQARRIKKAENICLSHVVGTDITIVLVTS